MWLTKQLTCLLFLERTSDGENLIQTGGPQGRYNIIRINGEVFVENYLDYLKYNSNEIIKSQNSRKVKKISMIESTNAFYKEQK